MNITLTLICLCDEQIRHMPADVVFITSSISTEDFL